MDEPVQDYKVTPADGGESYTMAGDRYTFLLDSEDTGGAYAVFEGWIPPNGGPVLHRHTRDDESWYVLEGTFEFITETGTVRGGPGTSVYGPRGRKHQWRNVGETPGRLLVTIVPGAGAGFFKEAGVRLADRHAPPKVPDEADMKRMMAAAEKYGNEVMATEADAERIAQAASTAAHLGRKAQEAS